MTFRIGEVVQLDTAPLEVLPANSEVYANDDARLDELVASVKMNGILEPLVVSCSSTGRFTVVSGTRRLAAAKKLGIEKVPCIVTVAEDLVLAMIEHNRYRQKTPGEIYREAQLLKRILQSNGNGTARGPNLARGPGGRVRETISGMLAMSHGSLDMLEEVFEHAEAIPDVVEALDQGRMTVYSAFRELRQRTEARVEIPGIYLGQYFAGKQRLVRRILPMITPHQCYVEPFGGFCSVLLNKPPSPAEVYNDASRDLVNLLACLKEEPMGLLGELSLMPYSRSLYEQLARSLDDQFDVPDVRRAAVWYYVVESSFSGLGNSSPTGGWQHGVTRSYPATFRQRWNMLLAVSSRFLNVAIENKDYGYVLEHYDSDGSFFYVDPPYFETEDALGVSFSPEQHRELAEKLSNLRASWLLTINDCPEVREIYHGYELRRVVVPHTAPLADGPRDYYAHLLILSVQQVKGSSLTGTVGNRHD